jgi:hypothetical protein
MSEPSPIPTISVWDILGHEESGNVKHFERFETREEAVSRLRELERGGDESLGYVIIESTSVVPDRTMPTENQRRALCDLMFRAFVALRFLGYDKKHEVVAHLADAFHNLPHEMFCEETWDWNLLEAELRAFESKHPDDKVFAFSAMLREVRNQP